MSDIDQLIDEAMSGVTVVVCKPCQGTGRVGLPTLSISCPTCRGRGMTTTTEREVSPMAATGPPKIRTHIVTEAERNVVFDALKAYSDRGGHVGRSMGALIGYGMVRVVFPAVEMGEAGGDDAPDRA